MPNPTPRQERRLVYSSDQLNSPEPHVIVPAVFRFAPGWDPDGDYVARRQWPDEEVDLMLSAASHRRLSRKAA